MYLTPPNGTKRKWDIVVYIDGCRKKVAGDRDEEVARRIGERVEQLIRAKENGDPPPGELKAWIDNMSAVLRKRMVDLGLIPQERFERNRPIAEHVDDFRNVVAARKTNTQSHADRQASMVRRLIADLKVTSAGQMTEDRVAHAVRAMGNATATRRHYIVAAKDFCKWMVRSKRARENPLADLQPPPLYVDPTIERVPLTVGQFQTLMKYMDTFELYPKQKARWTAQERKLVYWTAVLTAFRQNELRTCRVGNLLLDTNPALLTIRAANAKNRTKGAAPLRTDLANALKAFVEGRDRDEPLFPFPATNHGIVEMFRKDLEGAGIKWDFGKDNPETIDFHTLRSTAITWWIDTPGMTVKKVQVLARLKTAGLVATYSRNYKIDDFGWLDQGPSLVAPAEPKPD